MGSDRAKPTIVGSRFVTGRYTAAPMKQIVILISGRGSNMEAIVRACANERWDARIAAVISNRADAAGLAFAADARHRHRCRRPPQLRQSRRFRRRARAPGRGLRARHRRAGRLHAHPRRGLRGPLRRAGWSTSTPRCCRRSRGSQTHRRALEAGCKVAGASVHFVTTELDHGPIIGQAVVPVLADDTRRLARRRASWRRSTCSTRARSAGSSRKRSIAPTASCATATARRSARRRPRPIRRQAPSR